MSSLTRLTLVVAAWLFIPLACVAQVNAKIVLLRSDTTAAFLKVNGGNYELLLAPWRQFFSRHRMEVREMDAAQLAAVKEPGVLVLASTLLLSESERQAIRSRLAAGWSVLGTWAVGVRDEKAGWTGYGLIEELFGAQVDPSVAPGKDERFLLPYGETPLTQALPAGKRIYLVPTSEPLLRVRTRNPGARFGNYMRETTQPGALLGATAFDERAGARRAYLGFAETTWDGARADLDALLLGTLAWLANQPTVVKSAWPHPHEAAVLLEMDTEDKFQNSVRFAAQLEQFGLRGTFYSLTSEAVRHPAVMKRLASRHEVAYHADVHDGFAKLDAKRQDARLKAMIKQMRGLLPDAPLATGFRAPLEQYDATTEQLLRANGLRHHAASPASREDVLPGFSTAEPGLPADKALVVLPRTWLDDINLLNSGSLKAAAVEKLMLSSLEATVAMRGFGLLSLHTQEFYPGSATEKATPRLLQEIAGHGERVWTAAGEDIAQWWRDREAVQVSTTHERGELRVRLNAQRAAPQKLRLVLFAPKAAQPRLSRGRVDARLEQLDAYRWAIVLQSIPQGESELRVSF
jgi:peptidoglycan/xylan/chitin deacetylase (PgdA/CDA1 family)